MRNPFLAAVLFLLGSSIAFAQTPATHTYHGQIMDSMCAMMGGHAPNGYKATKTHTPKDCTLACVKDGSDFVLYNLKTKTTYKLDNQKAPRAFAGANVVITGTLNPATQTIHVDKITRAK